MNADPASRSTTRRRGWSYGLAIVLLLLAGALTARLGFWQLDRARQKQEIVATIDAGRAQPALALAPDTPREALVPWRPVWAQGVWLPDTTVLIDNRPQNSHPGYWVVTAMCLQSPDAPSASFDPRFEGVACDRAVAVLRGWLARPRPGATVSARPELPELPLHGTVEGELLEHVPQRFELGALTGNEARSLSFDGSDVPIVQNLDLTEYAEASGLALLPVVLQQQGKPDGLTREWEGPPVDINTHRGYALQWFSFAAIAWIAMGVLLVKAFIPSRRRR